MIFVDQLHKTVTKVRWCHMMTDGSIQELHDFAEKIGLQREWFQPDLIHPHYDITESVRYKAIHEGAYLVPTRIMLRRCKKAKK